MGERAPLAFIDLLNFIGLNTKSSNEVKQDLSVSESINTDLFRKYGAVSKCFGSSRVLNAVYTESSAPKKISWLGLWKNTALNGQTDRQILAAAGTKLQRVETNGTLTPLTGVGQNITENWLEGRVHQHQKVGDLMFITNQNPDLIGDGNTLVKYDGLEISRWGLLGPSNEPNFTKRIDTVGSAPPAGPNGTWIPTNCTAVSDSITTRDGQAISLTKTNVSVTNAYIEEWMSSPLIGHAFHTSVVRVYAFIPLGELIKLANADAITIRLTSDSQVSAGITIPDFTSNSYVWEIPIGELFEGWNLIELGFSDDETSIAFDEHLTIFNAPIINQLRGVRLGFNSRTNATLPAGIRFSLLQSFTRGNATVSEGAAGSVFDSGGTFSYKITFISKQGFESNAGPQTANLLTGSDVASLELTAIPVSADSQVIARGIYRTVADGNLWIFVDRINDNVTTTFSDTLADEALGSLTPPEAGDVSSDNSPPPPFAIIKYWKRTMFGAGNPENPNSLFWSNPDDVEGWPQLNTAVLDGKITAIYETYSSLIVATELGIWQVSGDNPDFRTDKIITGIGCVGRRAAGETRVDGWQTDRDGVRVYDANNPNKISEPIRDKFDIFDHTFLELTHSAHSKNNNCIVFCFTGATPFSYNADNFIYQYPVDEIGQGWWWQLQLPTSVNILDMEETEDDNGDFHLLFGSTDGMIYELFDKNAKSWATATGTEAIECRFKTKWLRLGQLGQNSDGVSGRVSPRQIEAITDGDPCTWNITMETATGPNQTTATASVTVPVVFGDENEKLMRYPVRRVQSGEYIRITAEQGTIDVDSMLLAMRLLFKVQPGQFPIETGDFNADL